MPRRERVLDPDCGPLVEFAAGLRRLREAAGGPGYRQLARRAHFSSTTLSDAAGGRRLPSLAVTLAYVRACGGDVAEWETRWRATAGQLASESAAVSASVSASVSPSESASESAVAGDSGDGVTVGGVDGVDGDGVSSPYPGLAAFQVGDSDRFFGRERLVEELLSRLEQQRCVVVLGASGVGKSSLLRAGLLAAVQANRPAGDRSWPVGDGVWPAVLFTPGARPVEECAVQLAGVLGRPAAALAAEIGGDPSGLHLAVRQALANRPADVDLLLVVDQFEEVFTVCRDRQERAAFIAALLTAAQAPTSRLRVVLGVRADFYGACTQHPGLVEAVRHGQVPVGPMTVDDLRRAITQPAVRAGGMVETALLAELIAEAADRPGVLPHLSHALRETWRRRRGTTMTLAGYQAAGGIEHALARTAETVYTGFAPGQRRLAKRLFLRLTALGEGTEDTKQRIAVADLDHDDPDTAVVLDALVPARLVVRDDQGVELAHEALIRSWPRLRGWLDEDRDGLRTHRYLADAARTWTELAQDPGALLRGARLYAVRDWAARAQPTLSRRERGFIEASLAAELRDQHLARRRTHQLVGLAAGLTVMLVVSLCTTAVAWRQRDTAVTQRGLAASRQLAAEAQVDMDNDVGAAIRASLDAMTAGSTVEARSALLSLTGRARYHGSFPLTLERSKFATVSPDGQLLALADNTTVELWNLRPKKHLASLPLPSTALGRTTQYYYQAIAGAFDATNHWLAIAWGNGAADLYDLTHPHAAPVAVTDPGTLWSPALAFSPDGQFLVLEYDDYVYSNRLTMGLWSTTNHQLNLLAIERPRTAISAFGPLTVPAVAAGPGGHIVAIATGSGNIVVWNTTTQETRIIPTGLASIGAMALHPDGHILAVAGPAGAIALLDTDTLQHTTDLKAYNDPTTALVFDHAGNTLVSASADGTIALWDLAHHDRPVQLIADGARTVHEVAISPDGFITAATDREIVFWNRAQLPFSGQAGPIRAVTFNPAGDHVASVAAPEADDTGRVEATIVTWDTKQRSIENETRISADAARFGFSANGQRMTIISSNKIIIWDVTRNQPTTELDQLYVEHPAWTTAVLSADGQLLASSRSGTALEIWDLNQHRIVTDLYRGTPEAVAFHPHRRQLAAAYADATIDIWDLSHTEQRVELTGRHSNPTAVAFRPGTPQLLVSRADGTLEFWDVAKQQMLDQVHDTTTVTALAFSPNGRRLATANADGTITIWDSDTRTRWANLITAPTSVPAPADGTTVDGPNTAILTTAMAWSPDGAALVTGGVDHTVTMWTIDTNRATRQLCEQLLTAFARPDPTPPACRR